MVYLWLYLAAAMLNCVTHVMSAYQCHQAEKVAILEKHTVQRDPTEHIDGTFSDVWVKKYHEGVDKCSYVKYTKQSDGRILETATFTTLDGKSAEDNPEYMKKTDKVGVYDINGNYLATNEAYSGKMYIIYSDGKTLVYYVCEIHGAGWNAAVQVKATFKEKLLSDANDNEVQKSLTAAKAALDQLASEYGEVKDGEMIQYKMEDLCP